MEIYKRTLFWFPAVHVVRYYLCGWFPQPEVCTYFEYLTFRYPVTGFTVYINFTSTPRSS